MILELRRPLGVGKGRVVWSVKGREDIVVKVAHRTHDGLANRAEWDIWNKADKNLKKYLVPCLKISPDSIYLIMEKGIPTKKPDHYPSYIKDAGSKNWVLHKNTVKLCDYADFGIAKELNLDLIKKPIIIEIK